jgi:hypothetical protein
MFVAWATLSKGNHPLAFDNVKRQAASVGIAGRASLTETSGFGVLLLLLGLTCIAIYLLPVIVAFYRDH